MTTTNAMCTYLQNALLNHCLANSAYASPTTVYLGLFLQDPTAAGTFTPGTYECNGTSYVRVACFGADITGPSGGVASNSAAINFPQAGGSWSTITWCGILDALTLNTGFMLFRGQLDVQKVISTNDTLSFGIGALSVTLD